MVDDRTALPAGVTIDMVNERARWIAIDFVRSLSDSELNDAKPPAFLCDAELEGFRKRCASELQYRSPVRKTLERHHKKWPAEKDDYAILLQIWVLCDRHATEVDGVMLDFFDNNDARPLEELTIKKLFAIAPQRIKKYRREKAKAVAEGRVRRDEM